MDRVTTQTRFEAPPPPYRTIDPKQNTTAPYIAPVPLQVTCFSHVVFGHQPQSMRCPQCQRDIFTHVEYEPGLVAWLSALVLCFCGCFCGCCLIPLCVTECLDAKHSCPMCQAFLGQHDPL